MAGRSIRFEPPRGYCTLDPTDGTQGAILDLLKKLQDEVSQILTVYSLCAEIAALASGSGLVHYGMLVANKQAGQVVPLTTATRRDALDQVRKVSTNHDLTGAMDTAKATLEKQGIESAGLAAPVLVEADDRAIYTTSTSRLQAAGRSIHVTGVYALTLVNQLLLSSYLYGPADDPEALNKLLGAQHALMAHFIDLNETPEKQARQSRPSKGWLGLDWERIAERGAIGGLVGAAFAVVAYLVRRLRRKGG